MKFFGLRFALAALTAALAACGGANPEGGQAVDQPGEPVFPPGFIEPTGQRSPFGNFLAGRFAERQRDFGTAATALNRALEESPDNLALLRQTFYVSLEAGQIRTALRLARRLEDARIDAPLAQILMATESVRRGEYEAGLRRLERTGRTSDLAQLSVPLALAWANVGAGDTAAALTATAALNNSSGFALLRQLHDGFIHDLAGRPAAAETAYLQALGGDPANAPVRVVRALGNFLERKGRFDEARAIYQAYRGSAADDLLFAEAIERLDTRSAPEALVASPEEGLAESYFDIASVLPKDRAGEVVLVYVRMALYLKPDFPLAQLLLGEVLDSFGQYEEAAKVYRSIDPADAYGWAARQRLADDLYDLGDSDGAIRILRDMSRRRAERSDVLVRLGNILRYEERYREAVDAYDSAFERMPESEKSNWLLYYSRGIALERSGQWERAEADLLKALELEPNQPFVLNYLGYSWVEQGKNLQRARAMLENAVAQRQEDGYIIDSMGWALYKLGEYANAVAYLERAVVLRPQDPVINDHLGDAYWRVGRTKEARIQWRRVLGLDPDPDVAESVGLKLREGLPAVRDAVGADG